MDLSPRAQKAVQASEGRRRLRWPDLGRTQTKLILSHPISGGYRHRANLASYVKKHLPQLRWDSKHCRWWAELNTSNLNEIIVAFTQAKEIQLCLSEGVKELLA